MRALIVLLGILIAGSAFAADDVLNDKIAAAMSSPGRPEADTARDKNRRPVETLQFFQLRDDMRVLELLPGGGWYTRILAPVLKDKGKLYLALGTGRVSGGLLKEPGFEAVTVLDTGAQFERDGPFGTNNLSTFEFGEKNLDLVLTFRNMHNFTPEARATINSAVFRALKSGGLYGVVDHTQRHMGPMTEESRRRVDPMLVVKEVLGAGFDLVDYSDLHYRPDDELRYEVGRKTVTGNTDRFTILFRKP